MRHKADLESHMLRCLFVFSSILAMEEPSAGLIMDKRGYAANFSLMTFLSDPMGFQNHI